VLPGVFGLALRGGIDAAGLAYVLSQQARPGSSPVVTDLVLTQYSAAGQRLWSRTTGAGSSQSASALLVSPAGVSTLTGTSGIPGQQLLASFDGAGNPIATRSIASSGPLGLAAGRNGEVVAVGAGDLGFLVVKHDAALNELWRTSHAASGGAQRVAVDAAGNLLVSGVTNAQTGQLTVVSNDWLTLKLDPSGALLWRHQLGTLTNRDDAPAALALGSDGAAYLTGSGWFRPAGATDSLSDQRSTVTLKLGSDGAPRWLANTPAALRGAALALGGDGGVLVLGDSTQLLAGDGSHVLLRYPQTGAANQSPLAVASASPASGTAPLNVVFSPAGSGDADGLVTSWRWDFGDGQSLTTSSGIAVSHSYAAAGSYSARLTVTDSLGASGVSAPVVVNVAAAAPPKPTAITLAATSVLGGQTVRATVRLSTAAGATVALSSSNRTVASVPASLVVPAGASQADVVISTTKVRKNTAVTIRATANGASASTTLTVRVR
jgi:PKD repeat protein